MFQRFAKKNVGCRRNTIGAAAKINLIEIKLQYFVFCVPAFYLECQYRFLDFSGECFAGCQKKGFGKLLGNGAGAFDKFTCLYVSDNRPQDAFEVDATVPVEVSILRGNETGFQKMGNIVQGNRSSLFHEQFGQNDAVSGI